MTERASLRAMVMGMEIGDTLSIPVEMYGYSTIRAYAYELGGLDRKYTTHRDKVAREYTIERVL